MESHKNTSFIASDAVLPGKTWLWLLVGCGVALVGCSLLTVLILVSSSGNKNPIPLKGHVTPSLSKTAVTYEQWKTYNDTATGYSFSYPATWAFKPSQEGCGPVFQPPAQKKYWLTICGPYSNSTDTPVTAAKEELGSKTAQVFKSFSLQHHPAMRLELVDQQPQYYHYTFSVYIGNLKSLITNGDTGKKERKQSVIGVHLYVQDKSQVAEAKQYFERILASMHFLN